ncbi:MAG: rhomboid family intramembrane serine protease [Ardenticatenaceae bacterium]|nr:rhomboid family intramembrane serine protease [Ardenticatenaceae bacterium]
MIVFAAQELLGGSMDDGVLLKLGSTSGELIMQGEIWRLFMAMFLHIGIVHLFFNAFALYSVGRNVESYFGYGRFLLIYLASGLFGNIVSFALRGPYEFSAGASGAIFGLIGAELGMLLFHRRQLGTYGQEQRKNIWRIVLINLVIGLSVFAINNAAHIGGFIAGLALGFLVAPRYLPVLTSTGENRYEDQASLKKLWAIPLITTLLLAGGIWGSIYLWQNYEMKMQEITMRIQYLPFSLPTLFAGDPLEYYGDEFDAPETVKLGDIFECYLGTYDAYEVDEFADVSYCSGYLDVSNNESTHEIDLTTISDHQQFSVGFSAYTYGGSLEIEIETATGETFLMRTNETVSPDASTYLGVIPGQISITTRITEGQPEMISYSISFESAD